MSKRKSRSRVLRQLAEDVIRKIAPPDQEIPDDEREDFVTSLVRQWITYEGNATIFVGDQQIYQFYLVLSRTPLGKPCIIPEMEPSRWMKQLREDWKLSLDDLLEVIDQLNRGQSAEVINQDGTPLRLWVNPKKRSQGIEPLVQKNLSPAPDKNYRIASHQLEEQFGDSLDSQEMDDLALSMVKQWQQYQGHACIFVNECQQIAFKLREHGDGTCDVAVQRMNVDHRSLLSSLGFPSKAFVELIARINLSQEIEFQDREGIPRRLWYDPKGRRMRVEPLASVQPTARTVLPPIFCPKCTAVLSAWRKGERQQTCPLCGHTISFP